MNTKILYVYFAVTVLLAACNAAPPNTDQSTPIQTLDISQIGGILPTIDPNHMKELAQLAPDEIRASGQVLYAQHCAACHGIIGEGQFPEHPMQPDETGRIGAPPHNENGHTWHHSDDLIISYILDGGMGQPEVFYEMPAFGSILSHDEAHTILAYIKSLWTEEQRLIQTERTLREE